GAGKTGRAAGAGSWIGEVLWGLVFGWGGRSGAYSIKEAPVPQHGPAPASPIRPGAAPAWPGRPAGSGPGGVSAASGGWARRSNGGRLVDEGDAGGTTMRDVEGARGHALVVQ